MSNDNRRWLVWVRIALQFVITALGLVAIVGSGGGGFPDMSCVNTGTCPGEPWGLPPLVYADLGPNRVTVQVGASVVFTVDSNVDQPTYRWCRVPAGTDQCIEIAGAAGATYTLTRANLGDDGTTFRVTVTGANGSAYASRRLAVSSMPGMTYQDRDFLESDWTVTTAAVPLQNGPTASASRAETGGNPGPFRTAAYTLPLTPSSVRVFYSALSAIYDPSVQGAIYFIDFSEDCIVVSSAGLLPYTGPMIEQAGRIFVATRSAVYCKTPTWTAVRRSSLGAEDFELVDGPACAAGESCPDFSGSGAQIRLGLVSGADLGGGLVPPVQTAHGFDNWKVTVWRR